LSAMRFPAEAEPPAPKKSLIPLVIDQFEIAREREKAKELLKEARESGDKRTEELAKKLIELWNAVEKGEITQEEALKKLAALDKELGDAEARKQALEEAAKELGDALAKNPKTKELGEALQQGDFDKAASEVQKLSDSAEKMSPEERDKLQKALEKAAAV